jgi:putative CocE/NonD family hydrolase
MFQTRDGVDSVALHTTIHFPLDRSAVNGDGRFPTIIDRSPYGVDDMEWIADIFIPFGYVAIGQDIRGTEQSFGNFSIFQSEADDGQDLGDWVIQQPWSDGRIYTMGASADGITSIQTPHNRPSWLLGQFLVWCPATIYNILMPHGAFKQKTAEDWFNDLTLTDESYHPEIIEIVHQNEAHTDFWRNIELNDDRYAAIDFPSAFWAGWYDLFQSETLALFKGYNTQSNPDVRGTAQLVIDPCGHCIEAQDFWTENIIEGRTFIWLSQAFSVFGIDRAQRRDSEIKNITFYVMSSNDEAGKEAGQYWTSVEDWPVPTMTDYYLLPGGVASTNIEDYVEEQDHTSYIHDPSNPIPTIGGNNLPDSIGGTIPCGPLDQGDIDFRDDVLLFETTVSDEELALTGKIVGTLFVSSDALDTDFNVKISDVYPTGEARILTDNAFRMMWREDTQIPVLMESGTVYQIDVDLWSTSYIVAPGHKLRITVSSSNFPRFNVNYGHGLLLTDPLFPGDPTPVTNTLYQSKLYQSRISLPIVNKRTDLPSVNVVKAVRKDYPMITDKMIEVAADGLKRKGGKK